MKQDLPEKKFIKSLATFMSSLILLATVAALVFTQAGFATAYVIFISNNLHQLYPILTFRNYAALLIGTTIIRLLCVNY